MAMPTSLEQYIARFPQSRALYERAKGVFRNGITHDARYIRPFPIYITRAKGSHKWDVDGYEYIDYFGGHGALILGHAHPAIVNAVREQIAKGTQYAACHELEIEWAELIKKLLPSIERLEFTNSGTEANMLALRLARAFTGRSKVIRFRGQMGGWYDSLMVGDREPWNTPVSAGLLLGVEASTVSLPVNDEKSLEQALSGRDIAGLICEPWGSYSGTVGYIPTFLNTVRDLTRKYGTVLIFDEVVSGFRYAPGGVQQVKGIMPDLTTLGKNLTGGLPGAGAVGGRANIIDMLSIKDGDDNWNLHKRIPHQGTFNGNPLCAAAGIAALKILSDGVPQKRASELGSKLRTGMESVMQKKRLTGCAYGERGVVHLYFGDCALRNACDRLVCPNSAKVRLASTGLALFINLSLNGVGTVGRAMDFFISAVHSDPDIDKTVRAFEKSVETLVLEGALNPDNN
jgi:glutamate-1-semialdehyde 2,1-aminomutase